MLLMIFCFIVLEWWGQHDRSRCSRSAEPLIKYTGKDLSQKEVLDYQSSDNIGFDLHDIILCGHNFFSILIHFNNSGLFQIKGHNVIQYPSGSNKKNCPRFFLRISSN